MQLFHQVTLLTEALYCARKCYVHAFSKFAVTPCLKACTTACRQDMEGLKCDHIIRS